LTQTARVAKLFDGAEKFNVTDRHTDDRHNCDDIRRK